MRRFVTRVCLCFMLTALPGCSEFIVSDSDSNHNVEDFESAWNHINAIYPLFDFKQIDWDSIHTDYRVRAEQSIGDEFYAVLIDLVGELKDPHAKVHTLGGLPIRPYISPRTLRDQGAFKPGVVRQYFDRPLRVIGNDAIEYEYVTTHIGYVRIATFGNDLAGHVNDIDIVINYFSEADGLIVDIRNNGGGGSAVYDPIIGRLISIPLMTESAFSRMGTRAPYTILPQGARQYTGPVVILINGTTFSGAEVFAERMRQLDYITLVGDTTAGGGVSSNSDPRHFLPSRKSISINYEAILRIDGSSLEWNGVPPAVRVPQSKTDIDQKRDRQLEAAIEMLSPM